MIYPYADPLGALNLAVMGDGDELQWHFDQTDFVVSLALQDADDGGDFEVAPFIRTADDERYDDVARVLAGDRGELTVQPMTPGTLLVFAGRNSMHRVSPIHGPDTRASSACSATTPSPARRAASCSRKFGTGASDERRERVRDRRGLRR